MATNMTINEAMDYLNYCEKEGCFDAVDAIAGLTEKEIIELAGNMMDRADAAYDAWKEQGGDNI